jgi:hypothetical protein
VKGSNRTAIAKAFDFIEDGRKLSVFGSRKGGSGQRLLFRAIG